MSQEHVEIVRRIYAGVSERGDLGLGFVAPEFELDVSDVMPDMGIHTAAEAAPLFKSYSEMFDDFHITVEQVVAAEGDRVVTAVRDAGRIKGSGVEVQNRFFHVFTFRDGKVTRWSSHTDRHRALEAAGLSE